MQNCKNDKAKELEEQRNFVLSRSATRVVTVADRRDDSAYPVCAEDVHLLVIHPMEVLVCELPGQMSRFVVKVGLTANIDPQARKEVQQDQNLADRANGVLKIIGLGLWLLSFQVSDQSREAEVQHIYLVDANALQECELGAHAAKDLRNCSYQVQYHRGAQIVDENVVEVFV